MFREEGNSDFVLRNFPKAANAYKRALIYLDYSFGETEEQESVLDEERFKCHINSAAVMLELEEYTKTVNECRLALSIKPDSVKAYFRRGTAQTKLGNYSEAKSDLDRANSLTADRDLLKSIAKALTDLERTIADYEARFRSIAEAALDIH